MRLVCDMLVHKHTNMTLFLTGHHVNMWCCSKVILTLGIALVLLGGGIAMITVGALSGIPHNEGTLAYENTSSVVTTFNTLNTKEVTLQSDAEFDIKAQYYKADSCSNLPSLTMYSTIPGNLSLPPKVIGYFLEGSVLSYKVCSAADAKVGANQAIQFYILDNLKDSSRKPPPPYESPSQHSTIKVGYNANVANQSKPGPGWICSKESELTFRVSKQSYYAVVVFPPTVSDDINVKYWYQSNITHKKIKHSSLTPFCPNSSESECTLHVTKHLPLEEHCVIAHIEEIYQQGEDAYIRIQITFRVWNGLVLFVCLGAVLVLASLVPCIVLCRRPLRKNIVTLQNEMSQPF